MNNDYVLTLNEQDMQVLTQAIGELPFKLAAPLVSKINQQITAAQEARVRNGSGAPEPEKEMFQ